ncbi:inositol 2-dehydrogenase [uncultured Tessaracoccus sp.]|uniref:inositol 2-dehydrogenase n=1 Tax=uncultured Tessaracoccus sp. TaxID=905023 RepID=UPI0025CFF4D5|nr:inositol 2-dehydrogenase [uncultured Tessaracoccus sp.]
MLSIAIIGAGRIGHVHARSVAAHPEARLHVVCDPDEEAARTLAEQHGSSHCTDPQAVFDDDRVDAVIIGSPTDLHVPQLLAAATRGKAVLCEKPIAQELRQVEAVRHDLDRITTPVMFGFNRRFDPSFRAAHDAATAGRLGSVEQLTIISRDPSAPPLDYVRRSGGIFRDMTIHDFDMARHFLGDIVEVQATGQVIDPAMREVDDFDAAVTVLTSRDGAIATIINNRRCASGYDQRLEVHGSEGSAWADNVRANTVRFSDANATEAQLPYLDFFLERYELAYANELDAFVQAVLAGTSPMPGIEDAIAALALADAATTSAKEGRPVRLGS